MGITFYLGRRDEAKRQLAAARVLSPRDSGLDLLEALLRAADGDVAGRDRLLASFGAAHGEEQLRTARFATNIVSELHHSEDFFSNPTKAAMLHLRVGAHALAAGVVLTSPDSKGKLPGVVGLPCVERAMGLVIQGLFSKADPARREQLFAEQERHDRRAHAAPLANLTGIGRRPSGA